MTAAEFLPIDGLKYPESARWRDGRLWIADLYSHRVVFFDTSTQTLVEDHEFDDVPIAVAPMPDGTPIVALMRSKQLVRLTPDGPKPFADLSSAPADVLNDMTIDGRGHIYVGTRALRASALASENIEDESLLLVGTDGTFRVVASGLVVPNGIVVTPDYERLLVAETRVARITVFDLHADGTCSNPRLFAQITGGLADGMCLDAEGAVWVGTAIGGKFLRVRDGGEVLDSVDLDGRWALSCALGGDDRRTLYMVSTECTLENLATLVDRESDLRSTSIGRVQQQRVDVPGVGWP